MREILYVYGNCCFSHSKNDASIYLQLVRLRDGCPGLILEVGVSCITYSFFMLGNITRMGDSVLEVSFESPPLDKCTGLVSLKDVGGTFYDSTSVFLS